MHFLFLLNSGIAAIELSGTGFFIAVAILACLLGVMTAGIFILIGKMSRAKREKQELEDRESPSSRQYHYASVVMLGVIPTTTYLALSILAGLVAVAAVVFTVLLLVLRKKGYTFISSKDAAALAEAERRIENGEEPEAIPAETEEQRQDAYTAPEASPAEDAFSVFAEEESVSASEEVYQRFYEEYPKEDSAQDLEGEVLAESAPKEQASLSENPTFADGTQPYKIVEKIVTETQKEVIREVPVTSAKTDAAAEQLMEKLTDFLDYELQKRKENDLLQASEAGDGTVATFAEGANGFEDEDLEDEDDADEDELDDGEDIDAKEEDDIDDEEPDAEDRFTGNERIIGFDETTGCYIVAHYRKSFEAKLIQARPHIKEYYSELKNALLAYKGTKSRISWTADSFHNGRTQIAKINVKTNILELYLALDPETLEGTVYRGKNVGSKKKYTDTPFQYKLRTPRKFKWAMELVQRTCEENGLSPIDLEKTDYKQLYPFESTESLVSRNLIKEYIRQEKPATTFELAPDHVPAVPDEDGSVIPANANFSWEFDNEMLQAKEEAVEEVFAAPEEPGAEVETFAEVEESASLPEAIAEPSSNVVKETVKITEMRYTERYYANADPSYEQIITTRESILPEDEAVPEENEAYEEMTDEPLYEEEIFEEDAVAVDAVALEELALEEEAFEQESEVLETDLEEESEEEFFFEEAPEEEVEEYAEEEVEEYAEEEVEEYAEEEAEEYAEEEVEEYAEEEVEEYAEEEVEEYAEEEAEEYAEEEAEEYAEEEAGEYAEEEAEEAPGSRRAAPEAQPVLDPSIAVIDICAVAEFFRDGDTVNLDTLKEKGLVIPAATTLKIYAGGNLDKRLTVEAHHFSLEAIFAIGTVGGETSMLY